MYATSIKYEVFLKIGSEQLLLCYIYIWYTVQYVQNQTGKILEYVELA